MEIPVYYPDEIGLCLSIPTTKIDGHFECWWGQG